MDKGEALAIVFAMIALSMTAFTIAIVGITRAIHAKFDKMTAMLDTHFDRFTAMTNAHLESIDAAIARGTQEHKEWREEMKAINEKVTEISIQQAVEKELRKRKKRRKRKA